MSSTIGPVIKPDANREMFYFRGHVGRVETYVPTDGSLWLGRTEGISLSREDVEELVERFSRWLDTGSFEVKETGNE